MKLKKQIQVVGEGSIVYKIKFDDIFKILGTNDINIALQKSLKN